MSALLSLCMIVRNEESLLPACLESLKGFVDEIVLVDTGSTDRTAEIAMEYGARVYHHPWENDFSRHRNQSISYATGEWILIMDADEVLRSGDGPRLREAVLDPGPDSLMVRVANVFNGGAGQSVIQQVRLFRRVPTIGYSGIVHNQLTGYRSTKVVPALIYHYGYDLDPEKMAAKFLRTSTLLKKRIEEAPDHFRHYHDLAVSYSMNRMPQEAAHWGIRAIEISAKAEKKGGVLILWTHFIVASSYLLMREFASAISWAQKGLERFEEHLDSWFVLAMAYRETNDWQKMKHASERYLTIHRFLEANPTAAGYMIHNTVGEMWRIYLVMGEYFLEMNQPEEAESLFHKAGSAAFSPPVAMRFAAETYRNRLLYEDAKTWYRRILEVQPDSLETLIALADLLLDQEHWHEALILYEKAIEIEPLLVRVHLKLARISLKQEDIESCVACCERMLKVLELPTGQTLEGLEDLSRLYLLIGHALDRAGSEDLFKEAAEIAMALHPAILQEVPTP